MDYRVFFERIDGVLDGLEIEYPKLMRIRLLIVMLHTEPAKAAATPS